MPYPLSLKFCKLILLNNNDNKDDCKEFSSEFLNEINNGSFSLVDLFANDYSKLKFFSQKFNIDFEVSFLIFLNKINN